MDFTIRVGSVNETDDSPAEYVRDTSMNVVKNQSGVIFDIEEMLVKLSKSINHEDLRNSHNATKCTVGDTKDGALCVDFVIDEELGFIKTYESQEELIERITVDYELEINSYQICKVMLDVLAEGFYLIRLDDVIAAVKDIGIDVCDNESNSHEDYDWIDVKARMKFIEFR